MAQRESASFTPRRSLVRSQYRPPSSAAGSEHRTGRFDARTTPEYSNEQHGTYLPLSTDTVIAVTITGELAAEYPVMQLPPITAYTASGVIGRPSLSSAENGKAVLASLTHSFADVLQILKP